MRSVYLLGILIVTVVFIAGCDVDRPLPTTERSHPFSITSVVASPPIVVENQFTQLTAFVTNYDEDILSYSWEATRGKILGVGSQVRWQAPNSSGFYEITVTVSDIIIENSDTKTIQLKVISRFDLIIPGIQAATIRLRETFGTVKARYGEPDDVSDNTFEYPRLGVVGFTIDTNDNGQLDECDTIYMLGVTKPYKGITEEGVGIGSSRREWEEVFGPPDDTVPLSEILEVPFSIKGEVSLYPVEGLMILYMDAEVVIIFLVDVDLMPF